MGYFFCKECGNWWGSFNETSIAEHNFKHNEVLEKRRKERPSLYKCPVCGCDSHHGFCPEGCGDCNKQDHEVGRE